MPDNPIRTDAWTRSEVATHLAAFEQAFVDRAISQRGFATEAGVPRTTLQHWLSRRASTAAGPAAVAFFESPEGLVFLHRLMVALLFVFTFVTSAGVRRVLLFLDLAGLSPFVAASFGSLQRLSSNMEGDIRTFAMQQRNTLAEGMAPKAITVCQDETFHPAPCLVAIEPVSDFLLLESYAQGRDQQTWDAHMKKALEGLKVQVVQSTSDEAKALHAHAQHTLGAHHSPDLFHIQQELSRASAVGLGAQVRATEKKVVEAAAGLEAQRRQTEEWAQRQHGPGRPPDFAARLAQAELHHQQVQEACRQASERQQAAREAIRAVGEAYHPVDIKTGKRTSPEQVEALLRRHMNDVETSVRTANLPERCLKAVAKAKRLLVAMVATLTFYEKQVARRLDELALSPQARSILEGKAIPAAYLRLAAKKASKAEQRHQIASLADELLDDTKVALTGFATTDEENVRLSTVAGHCAQLFQRASSCVEGRNGQLSLRHHSLHRLSPQRLEALTAVHNYFLTRSDGTTAAERFFGAKHSDMFKYLLARTRPPPRPMRHSGNLSPPLLH